MRPRQEGLIEGEPYYVEMAPALSRKAAPESGWGTFLGYQWRTLRDLTGQPFAVSCIARFQFGERTRELRVDGGALWKVSRTRLLRLAKSDSSFNASLPIILMSGALVLLLHFLKPSKGS